MNTQVAPGTASAPAGNAAQAAPVVVDPAGQNNGAAVVNTDASWLTGLQDEGNRTVAQAKGWDKSKSPDVVITSYRELESRLGKSVLIPEANAPAEEYNKLYTALGKPAKSDGYQFKLASDLPANFPYDDAFATEYKNWAFDANLTPPQAQTVHDKFVARAARQMADAQTAQQTAVSTAHQAIQAKWGDENSVGYKRKADLAGRAIRKLGLSAAYKRTGLLTADGAITDAEVAFSLATIGEGLFAEDSVHGQPGHNSQNNPWETGKENLTEQGRIQRENPELAKSLITAAGLDPAKALWKRS